MAALTFITLTFKISKCRYKIIKCTGCLEMNDADKFGDIHVRVDYEQSLISLRGRKASKPASERASERENCLPRRAEGSENFFFLFIGAPDDNRHVSL